MGDNRRIYRSGRLIPVSVSLALGFTWWEFGELSLASVAWVGVGQGRLEGNLPSDVVFLLEEITAHSLSYITLSLVLPAFSPTFRS